MKTRLGALAIAALLAACSGQDSDTKSGGWQARGLTSADTQTKGIGAGGLAALSQDKARTLGNAPDRGELFTYDDKAGIKHQGAYTLRPVRLSEEHAIRGVATGLMTVPAPDGSEIKIRYERHEESTDGNWSWIGKVIGGDAAQEAIFTFGEEAVFGSIPQAAGPALRLTTKGGIAYLMQADPDRLKRGHRAGGDVKTRARSAAQPHDSDTALVATAMAKAKALAKTDVSTKAFTGANTIDLVLGYSNGFVTANGGASAAVTRLSGLVAVANQALLNSNINARIRVVAALQVTYADNTDNEVALEQLTGHDGVTPFTPPASLLPLRTARDQNGADLVTLVRDFQPQNNGCGIAWLNGANGANITIAADAPFGYSVVSDGEYDDGTNTYFCEDITLVHELAHNMGSAHDIANAAGVPGRYPYSYGYKTTVANGNFFTVMAYGDDNQQLYRLFSNPLITACAGLPCGVANQADNARSLTQTIPVITTFRNTVVPILLPPRQDINLDAKSDLFYHNQSAGKFEDWIMSAQTRSSVVTTNIGTAYSLLATGDFNGDNRADLLWGNSSRAMYVWIAKAGGFDTASLGTYSAGFTIKGAGDVNGDGKADVVLHNQSTGAITIWLMNGLSVASVRNFSVGTAYSLAAAGDFDGNGKLDLVWRNGTTQVTYMWLGDGTGFPTQASLGAIAANAQIIGAGDVNADGMTDLLFRNASNGTFSFWRMNGGTVVSSGSTPLSPTYTLAAVGDYNGDGKVDLVWHNSSRVQYMWLGSGTSFVSQYLITSYASGYPPAPTGSLW